MNKVIGQGRTAEIYKYSDTQILKLFLEGYEHLALQEYNIAMELAKIELPIPKVYAMVESNGRKGIIYEYITGKSMLSLISQNPLTVRKYGKELAKTQKSIHQTKMNSLISLKERLIHDIAHISSLTEAQRGDIIKYLQTLPDGDKLCHYDFHPDNLLIKNGNVVIIDWMTASIGDPYADVCRTSLILTSNSVPPDTSKVMQMIMGIFRKSLYKIYIAEYTNKSKEVLFEIQKWLLPVAAARLMEAIPSEKEYLINIIENELRKIKNKN